MTPALAARRHTKGSEPVRTALKQGPFLLRVVVVVILLKLFYCNT
jgi:hypothetical protein